MDRGRAAVLLIVLVSCYAFTARAFKEQDFKVTGGAAAQYSVVLFLVATAPDLT